METKYKVGQIIRFCDEHWKCPEGVGFSNEVDDFVAIIEAVDDIRDKIKVKVLSVNTKNSKGRWRPTTMRTIGNAVELYLKTDEPYITLTEMSEILYG